MDLEINSVTLYDEAEIMGKLLYIQASPRIERSYSIAAANAFIESYREVHPADEIFTMNLFRKDLPPFDGLAVQAKYTIMHGLKHTEEELGAWRIVEALIQAVDLKFYLEILKNWLSYLPYNRRSPSRDTF
jgi:FMN-dependent NADH-azoreductase